MNTETILPKQKIAALRAAMKKLRLAAYVVPRQDEFQGEYVGEYAERLRWLTGFAGSWGTAIVGQKSAAIFVDGRYTLQVLEQVDAKLFVPHHLINSPPATWIESNLRKGERLGFDPWLLTPNDSDKLSAACKNVGATAVPVADNLIDEVWHDQPEQTTTTVTVHELKYAGRSLADKAEDMRKELALLKVDAALIADPSNLSWLFNLRARNIPCIPIVPAYAIIHKKGVFEIFLNTDKPSTQVLKHLGEACRVRKLSDFTSALQQLGKKKQKVALDYASAPVAAKFLLDKSGATIVKAVEPCTLPKAEKNSAERQGARNAHRKDGEAMVRFLHWLETVPLDGTVSEWAIAEKLNAFRAGNKSFIEPSFESISATAGNAAIPHYHVDRSKALKLEQDHIFLIDSGGQYFEGTTDITRTIILGQPSDEMKDRFTRVLKGMIQISLLQFPKGTTGSQIDVLARAALWKAGLDYDHGTGHGVGSYLSVHEGPAQINKTSTQQLLPGMIISNEPGYYKAGQYGIRIENLLLVSDLKKPEGGERDMLSFETLTLCPIERRLIETRLLTREELEWLDQYHARVWRELRPFVDGPIATWLTKVCGPLR